MSVCRLTVTAKGKPGFKGGGYGIGSEMKGKGENYVILFIIFKLFLKRHEDWMKTGGGLCGWEDKNYRD